MQIPPDSATKIEMLHRQMSASLERIAWAILRDWPLASDAVQEAFALLTEKWGEIPHENRQGWLVRTVQLTSQNLRRKQLRAEQLPQRLHKSSPRGPDERESQEREAREQQERKERLAQALAKLPEAQQVVVRMRLQEELTFAEIAERLQLPLGTVLSRMRLALEKLRRMLD